MLSTYYSTVKENSTIKKTWENVKYQLLNAYRPITIINTWQPIDPINLLDIKYQCSLR